MRVARSAFVATISLLLAGVAALDVGPNRPNESGISSLVADSAPGGRAVPPPVLDTGQDGPPLTLYPIAEALDRVGEAFPAAAAGGYWDTGSRTYFYRIVTDAAGASELRMSIEAELANRAPLPAPIEIAPSRVSMATLLAAANRLNDDRAWAEPHASRVHRVLADRLNMLLRVSTSADADEVAQLAAAAGGIDAYARHADGPVTLASSGGNRRHDHPSFYNGIALWLEEYPSSDWDAPGTADCTGGFRMNKGSSHFISSAEHCGAYNTYFWHRADRVARTSGVYTAGGWDLSLLARFTEPGAPTTSFTPPTFWGDYNTTTTHPLTNVLRAWPLIGEPAWSSGANGGRVSMRVLDYDVCPPAGSATIVFAETNYGAGGDTQWVMGGDSGGPVVRANTGTSDPTDQIALGVVNCTNLDDLAVFTPIHVLENLSGSVVATQ